MKPTSALRLSTGLRALALAGLTGLPTTTAAGEMTLTTIDGSVDLTGQFVAFEDGHYVISTEAGHLSIAAHRVTCAGPDCSAAGETPTNVVKTSADMTGTAIRTEDQGMMPFLLQGYARFLDPEDTGAVRSEQEIAQQHGLADVIEAYRVSSASPEEAFAKLLVGRSDISVMHRRMSEGEARALFAAGAGNMTDPAQEHPLGIESLAIVTHPDNPIARLSLAQLTAIFEGRITNWSALGGPDAPLSLFVQKTGAGAQDLLADALFEGRRVPAPQGAHEVKDSAAMIAAVTADPFALGYVTKAYQDAAKPLSLVNACGIEMVPDAFSVRTGAYTPQRPVYLYNRRDLSSTSEDFVQFLTSPAGQTAVTEAGYVSFGIARRAQTLGTARARALLTSSPEGLAEDATRQMIREMPAYDRLSTMFRFRSGSSQLTQQSVTDMQELIAYLATQPEGTEISLVGFSDDVGPFDDNLRLSTRRAARLAGQLVAAGRGTIDHIEVNAGGFGEIAPIACNDEAGRAVNRRVEVWIKAPGRS